ncbi:MAG: hypothetical protein JXA37_06255 [Chloroflexia bacterium]|nr:hypothetical protein [Chloroflexia bacterium]
MAEADQPAVPPATGALQRDDTPWLVPAIILLIGAIILVGVVWADWLAAPLRWLINAALLTAFSVLVGYRINRRPAGVLIDTRFKISLSRLQIALWTVLVLSAYLTISLSRSLPGTLYDLDEVSPDVLQALRKFSPDKQVCFSDEDPLDPNLCQPDPLNIGIPEELLIAMGISTASFAGAAIVKSTKRDKQVDLSAVKEVRDKQGQLDQARAVLEETSSAYQKATEELTRKSLAVERAKEALAAAESAEEREGPQTDLQVAEAAHSQAARSFIQAQSRREQAQQAYERLSKELEQVKQAAQQEQEGLLHRNNDPSQASWEDLFRGEEIGNYKLVDMAKVQMFFFTVALIFGYSSAMYGLLENTIALYNPLGIALPVFTAGMNGLLAISHAGYLTVKTVDHTPVEK